MLPGGCGTLEPREGSQRHLGLRRTTWLWGQDRNLTGALSHWHPPWPGCHLPPHPERQNRHRERVPASVCHPRAQGHAECVQAGRTWHGDIGCWQWFGDSPSASPGGAATSKRSGWGTSPCPAGSTPAGQCWEMLEHHGHHWEQHQTSTKASTATGTPQCPQLRTELVLNSSYPAILTPAPCLDQSSLLDSRIVFSKANNAQPDLGSQCRELLSRCRCSSCRAGSGPVTPIHGIPRCRSHLPSRPAASGKLPQPSVPGFRFPRAVWEEQTKQCQDSLLPGEPPLLLPAAVPCALHAALPGLPAGFSLPSSTRGCLCPSAPMTGPWLPFGVSASRGFCCRAGWLR